MIDLILIVFLLAVFYAGFWCGNKFGTVSALFQRAKDGIKSYL